jgi:glutaredoxin
MSLDLVKIPDTTLYVEGSRKDHEIWLATISTCMWCKRGKQWLKKKGYSFSYLDIDKIPIKEKNELKKNLEAIFGVRPRFPFIVVDKTQFDSGYNPDIWEEMLK